MTRRPSSQSATMRRNNQVATAIRSLRALAWERGPEVKLPTHRDLCASLSVTRITLDAALDVLESQNVLRRRQGSGIYVSPELLRKRIAVVMAADFIRSGSVFWGLLWSRLIEQTQERSLRLPETYQFHLATRPPGAAHSRFPDDLARHVSEGLVDGIIGIGLDFREEVQPSECGVPTASLFGPGDWTVMMSETHELTAELARAAAEAAGGRAVRVSILRMHVRNKNFDLEASRTRWMVERLEGYNIPCPPGTVHLLPSDSPALASYTMGRQAAEEIFSGRPWPDVLLIDNDETAQGVLAAMEDLQIRIGQDVAVVTHSNAGSPILLPYEDRITRVVVDPARLAETVVAVMGGVLAGDPPAEREILIAPTIIRPVE